MKKRILILSLGVGGGHNSAAMALDEWAKKEFSHQVETRWMDVLDYTGKTFRGAYCQSYLWLVQHFPSLYGAIYEKSVEPGKKKLRRLRTLINRHGFSRVFEEMENFKPDLILSTHFKATNIGIGRMPSVPLYTVVTDYDAHSFWLNPKCAGYFVASKEVKSLLVQGGIQEDKIKVTGIPLKPRFHEKYNREEIRKDLQIPQNKKVILLMGGGFGSKLVLRALSQIRQLKEDFHCIVIAGKNAKLKNQLVRNCSGDSRIQVLGYTKQVPLYMAVADFMVTKAGGLTVSEALAREVPLVIFKPIPGQEEVNSHYLMEKGAGVQVSSPSHLRCKIRDLLENKEKLALMRWCARKIKTPLAGREIIGSLVGQKGEEARPTHQNGRFFSRKAQIPSKFRKVTSYEL